MGERLTGTVKWFNDTKGFGFITPSDGSDDLFVHQSSIRSEGFRSLGEGETVEFQIDTGEDGRTKAVEVTGPKGGPVRSGGGRGGYGGSYGGGGGYGGSNGRGGRGGGSCYNCGESGHFARECPNSGGGGR